MASKWWGLKLYISSLEVNHGMDPKVICKSKYILFSFAYLTNVIKNHPFYKDLMLERNRSGNLILDSGAFTFMNGKKISKSEMDSYCQKYIDFVKKYHIRNYVELDVDAVFGTDQAMKYREKLESEIGYQCMPIWHKERGMQAFKQDVEKYDYIGIGGIAMKQIKKSDLKNFKMLTSYARKRHTKIHAMGFTPSHDVYKYGFYSSDSSSWNSSVRYGGVSRFDGTGISTLKGKKYKKTKKLDTIRILQASYLEWLKYQEYVNNKGVI